MPRLRGFRDFVAFIDWVSDGRYLRGSMSAMSVWKYFVRGAAIMAALLVVVGSAIAVHVFRTWDRHWDAPLPAIHASADPEVIRRGEYLVRGPAHCAACHTSNDRDRAAADNGEFPPLSGGRAFRADPLGVIYSKNLTPDPETGIGRYSDGQIARMLRWSVRPDGKASVQLLMPFANLSESDLTAIISYLRAQPAVRNPVPENHFTVIGKVVKSFAPVFQPRNTIEPVARTPEMAPTVERGKYLARTVANCVGCHTKRNPISFAAVSAEFSGGAEMEPASRPGADPSIWFVTPNLTPARGSALSKFPDRDTFVARFQKGGVHHLGSPMPWESFGQMSREDLGALYQYLHSLPAEPGPTGEPTFHKGAPPPERVASR